MVLKTFDIFDKYVNKFWLSLAAKQIQSLLFHLGWSKNSPRILKNISNETSQLSLCVPSSPPSTSSLPFYFGHLHLLLGWHNHFLYKPHLYLSLSPVPSCVLMHLTLLRVKSCLCPLFLQEMSKPWWECPCFPGGFGLHQLCDLGWECWLIRHQLNLWWDGQNERK